jgi:hypothetical protein
VRDPTIALMGLFRNRGPNVVEDVPDRENHLTEAAAKNKAWLIDSDPAWDAGLDLAEVSANLLEALRDEPHILPAQTHGRMIGKALIEKPISPHTSAVFTNPVHQDVKSPSLQIGPGSLSANPS